MTIKFKMIVNALVFVLLAIALGAQELYMMHPDLTDFFDLKM